MALAIIVAIIVVVIIYVILKPYFIKYDTTLLFTGGLGTGKTLNAVKIAVKIHKRCLFDIKLHNWWIKQKNRIVKWHNNKKHVKKQWKEFEKQELPRLITNIPVNYGTKRRPKWSTVLTKEMLTFKERIPEFSTVLIDETPQMINQFNWNLKEVQYTVNEIITFWRHYIGGKLILTAQDDSDIVKQIRGKMNTFYRLSNFRKFLFFFYKCDICQLVASEYINNVSIGFYEDNTKTVYGTLFKKLYDSRCYSIRYDKTKEIDTQYYRWNQPKTKKVIRFAKYDSPLDEGNTN